MSSHSTLIDLDGTALSLHSIVSAIDATPSESCVMDSGTILPGIITDADHPARATSPPIANDSNAPMILAEPITPPSHSSTEFENPNFDVVMRGYLANSQSSIDMTVFEFHFLAQLDPRLKGKVLSVLTKAFLDLKAFDDSEEVFGRLLGSVSHDRGRNYVVALVAAGSALLGALAMFLVLAFL
ncbi:hypothetical protein F5879DRAFT_986913 [Lentinula edodes]|nr:hypothetical protein F5879DRAFT_986913 [Lentinula edodes]